MASLASHPLRQVLEGVHAGSCPGELNFHCHTTCSDGSLRPEQLQHWFAQQLGQTLDVQRLRRESLQLRQS